MRVSKYTKWTIALNGVALIAASFARTRSVLWLLGLAVLCMVLSIIWDAYENYKKGMEVQHEPKEAN